MQQMEPDTRLGVALVCLGLVTEDDIAEALIDSRVIESTPKGYSWQDPAARYVIEQQPTTRAAHSRIADYLLEANADPGLVADQLISAQRYADAHRPLLDSVRERLDQHNPSAAKARFSQWQSLMERLAVAPHDPRRLAGRRFARQLDDA